MANEATTAIGSIVVTWAEMTIAQKKENLTTRLNEEISTTSSTWVKARDTAYLAFLSYANEYILNKINSWIS